MRLIDAEQIGLTDMEIIMCDGNYKKALEMLIDKIANAPTIDAVKHGRWITVDYEEPRRYGCSECHRMVWQLENFCPNCGADMRKQKLQYGDEDTSQGGLMSAT